MAYKDEKGYLDALKHILAVGDTKDDRTGVGTISYFGITLEFNLLDGFPLLTTKQLSFTTILRELIFFISGETNTKILEEQGVTIWKENTSKEFLSKKGLQWQEGDMGPGYSFQWRHFGAEYTGCGGDYTNIGVDQLKNLITGLRTNPFSRRHIVSAWNVVDLPNMALPPCHCLFQFNVSSDKKYIDCILYQRSGDMFLGIPFNIASYAILMHIVGAMTGYIPRRFVHNIGDAHIYTNHVDQVKRQLEREPYALPKLKIVGAIREWEDVGVNSFELVDYMHHPRIKASMAI